MNKKLYEYDAVIMASEAGAGGAFVAFPYDVRDGRADKIKKY